MLPGNRLLWPLLRLEIKHVPSKVIQLRLHELRRQVRRARVLEVLQRGAQTRDMRIHLRRFQNDVFQRRVAVPELICDAGVGEEVVGVGSGFVDGL